MKDNNEDQKSLNFISKNKTYIVISCVLLIIVFIIYFFINTHNAKSQIKQLEKDINQHHYTSLVHTLSSSDKKMTKSEAKQLVQYFEDEKHRKQFNQDIKCIKSNLKEHHDSSELGSIKNDKNEPMISISKDGKRFFFIDHLSMKVHYRKVYVHEGQQSATYTFNNQKKGVSKGDSTSYIGQFIDGKYEIPTEKAFKDSPVTGAVDGHLYIDTNKRNKNNQIIASQDFNQTRFKVNFKEDKKIKNLNLYINNQSIEYKKDKTYGYFPNIDTFTVYGTGKYKDHTFKTNKIKVMQDYNNKPQHLNLKFNQSQIKKAIKADQKKKKKAEDVVKKYMKHLNEAYKDTSYKPIKGDIKSNSKAEKFMQPKFKNKQNIKYHDIQIESSKKQGNHVEVVISKKYKENKIQTRYQLQQDGDEYKITDIADV